MSERLGPVTFEKSRRSPFLVSHEVDGRSEYSDQTAESIDREVRGILEASQERARALLRTNRRVLERVARRLLEQEVIDAAELKAMLEEEKKEPAPVPGAGSAQPLQGL